MSLNRNLLTFCSFQQVHIPAPLSTPHPPPPTHTRTNTHKHTTHSRLLTCRMVVLIEAQGPKHGSRCQTQNFLDLEVSAAPHLRHAEPDGSTQCDLDPRPAGTAPTVCVCVSGPVKQSSNERWSTRKRPLFLFSFISLESHYEQEAGFQTCTVTLELQG